MDFDFDADQQAFRDSVREALAREAPSQYVRAMLDDPAGVTPELWSKFADLGWTGVLVPAEHGGLGLGMVDAVLVLEETGRLPLPGPFLSSAVLATLAARRLGATDLLGPLADGTQRGTVAIEEATSRDPLEGIETRAVRNGDGWRLRGVKHVVLDAQGADWAIVAASDEHGLGAYLVSAPEAIAIETIDPTRKMARLELDETPARRLDGPDVEAAGGDATPVLRRVLEDGALALCAELIGCCDRAIELAGDYAKVREQFGKPIGAFQAVKHLGSDMIQRTELARVVTHWAAWASDVEADERAMAAAMAKSWVGEAATGVTGDCIQIFGAVGFTWDCDAGLFYKRAKANDLLLGQSGWHRQRVADFVLGPVRD